MLKRSLSFFLSLTLLMLLCACSVSSGNTSEGYKETLPFKKGALNIPAQAVTDTTVYDEPNGLPILGLYFGDRVFIHSIDGDWAETNLGWIPLSALSYDENGGTQSTDFQLELLDTALRGQITGDTLRVRDNPGDGEVLDYLDAGDWVEIYYITHVDETLWCHIGSGWISMDYVHLTDFDLQACFPAYFSEGTGLYDQPGRIYSGNRLLGDDCYLIIYKLRTIDETVWGQTDKGWVQMGAAILPGNVRIMNGTAFEYEDQETTAPTQEQTQPTQDNTIKPTPNNTKLVGSWMQFSPKDFLATGSFNPISWYFGADGTFSTGTCEYAYFDDQGGFYGASGGGGYSGVFTYDGTNLVLYYQYYSDADPSAGGHVDKTERYTGTISNDTVTFGNMQLCRGDNINHMIRDVVVNNAGHGGSSLQASWYNYEDRAYTFYTDGTFYESSVEGDSYGHYICINGTVYMAYNKRNNQPSSYLYVASYSISGDTLTLEHFSMQYGTVRNQYERGTE